ncbi:MAG: DinB family protein [Planctomycetaceae bacterium]|nr:DinB family protein [Planctomycetaceae bacterium]
MSMKPVLHSFAYCLDYLRDQVADVEPTDMVVQPSGVLNHPAWVIGHLTFSCQALGGEIGLAEWLPTTWADKFGTGSVPVSEVSHYPNKTEALATLRDAQCRITDAIEQPSEAQLDEPLPDATSRAILPTVRHAITQVLIAHPANHIGQLTIWRRAMGLPQVGRPFM